MRDIAAVIFDLDDTLYRERRFVLSGLAEVARTIDRRHGVPAAQTFRHLQGLFRRVGREALLQTYCRSVGLPVGDVPEWVTLIRAHQPRLRLPRSSAAMLDDLRRRGLRLGILTNGNVMTQEAKVHALGLGARVDAIVLADRHAVGGKPHRACFDAVIEALGVSASRSVYVGDHAVKDIDGARAAGLRAIWVSRHGAACPAADAIVSCVAEVPEAVRVLEGRHAPAS